MQFEVSLLGTNSAIPAFDRFPTAQVLNVQGELYMIDCGEGAQMRLQALNIKVGRLHHIFISHLHGDHVFGLFGLLTSLNLNGRKEPLTLFGPPDLEAMIMPAVGFSGTVLQYPIAFIAVDQRIHSRIYENEHLEVFAFPLVHRLPTTGFLFREKERPRNILSEKISEWNLSIEQIKQAKKGEDIVLADGTRLENELLTRPGIPPRSYAYCSDTAYTENIIPYIKGADLLYHESTFCEDNAQRAVVTRHSTAREAAEIARRAGVGKLILGHYSSRYRELDQFEKEARAVFPNTVLGRDGVTYEVAVK